MYLVLIPRRVIRQIEKIPEPIRRRIVALVEQLKERGPIQPEWPNYGKLGTINTIVTFHTIGWRAGILRRER